jgi:hypothetical protein
VWAEPKVSLVDRVGVGSGYMFSTVLRLLHRLGVGVTLEFGEVTSQPRPTSVPGVAMWTTTLTSQCGVRVPLGGFLAPAQFSQNGFSERTGFSSLVPPWAAACGGLALVFLVTIRS